MQKSLFESIPQRPASKGELKHMPVFQLKERLDRQRKILANPALVQRLPDKGAKIRQQVADLSAALDGRESIDQAAKTLEAMTLDGSGATSEDTDPHPMLNQTRRVTRHEVAERSSVAIPDDEPAGDRQPVADASDSTTAFTGSKNSAAGTPQNSSGSATKRRPAKDIAAVRERIIQSAPTKSKVLSLDESAVLLQDQEKRLKEIERKNAEEHLKKTVGKYNIGPLPGTLPAEFQQHRGAVKKPPHSVGDRQAVRIASLKQSFVDVADDDGGEGEEEEEEDVNHGHEHLLGVDDEDLPDLACTAADAAANQELD
ncbi:uncharacterized protein LOC135819514 [Sycon ciliatum]|uniref:uncharacterized protein LOC135819514 n=1 Tax=Sycon ciliatum TaxID=27933 RepID=UPI0031F6D5F6